MVEPNTGGRESGRASGVSARFGLVRVGCGTRVALVPNDDAARAAEWEAQVAEAIKVVEDLYPDEWEELLALKPKARPRPRGTHATAPP
jgi:hypothetical protein